MLPAHVYVTGKSCTHLFTEIYTIEESIYTKTLLPLVYRTPNRLCPNR